jgi:hypothetical protein
MAGAPLRLATAGDEAGGFKDFQVARDGGEGDVERLGKLVHRRLAEAEAGEDGAAGWVREGRERLRKSIHAA